MHLFLTCTVLCVSGEFDMTPGQKPGHHCQRAPFLQCTLGTRAVVTFDIFVKTFYILDIILPTHTKRSQTVNTQGPQHVVEEDCVVGVVIGMSTWTLSSWFGPPNA